MDFCRVRKLQLELLTELDKNPSIAQNKSPWYKCSKYSDFLKVDIRVGTILRAEENNALKKYAIILEIDFGEKIGIKKSSAQLQSNYTTKDLINKQVAAVINFPPKQIGKIISEVLVLGFPDNQNEPILVSPDYKIENGGRLY